MAGVGMNQTDWDKAEGEVCLGCGEEVLRIIDGICFSCYNRKIMERDLKMEAKSERRYFSDALRKGKISIKQLREGRL